MTKTEVSELSVRINQVASGQVIPGTVLNDTRSNDGKETNIPPRGTTQGGAGQVARPAAGGATEGVIQRTVQSGGAGVFRHP